MRMALKLPPGTVAIAFTPEDCARLIEALANCAILNESADAYTRMPEGQRDGDQYLTVIPADDARLAKLREEVRAEGRKEAADMCSRIEAFVSGGPVPAHDPDKPLAVVVPHRPRGEEDQ